MSYEPCEVRSFALASLGRILRAQISPLVVRSWSDGAGKATLNVIQDLKPNQNSELFSPEFGLDNLMLQMMHIAHCTSTCITVAGGEQFEKPRFVK